jgi:RNA polymerase sigma factor (sigma-70 family)
LCWSIVATVSEVVEQWFAREILIHEASLTRYLTRVWPSRADVADLRQEIYVRVFEAALVAFPTHPKAFLFTTARHLMTDHYRRNRIVFIGMRGDLDGLNVLIDERSPEQRLSGHQELGRLAQAFDQLPQKCRTVMWLRKVEQLSQREVAERLGVGEKAVEKQVARGMRLLAQSVLAAERTTARGEAEIDDPEADHG